MEFLLFTLIYLKIGCEKRCIKNTSESYHRDFAVAAVVNMSTFKVKTRSDKTKSQNQTEHNRTCCMYLYIA